MHSDPEYAKGALFRATQEIDELTCEEELQALVFDGVLVVDETMQAITDAWDQYKQAKVDGESGAHEFVTLAMRLDDAQGGQR